VVSVTTLLLAALAIIFLWGYLETWRLRVVKTRFKSDRLPPTYDRYRIVLLGGLHLRRLSGWTRRLQETVRSLEPDIILLPGNIKPTHSAENSRIHQLLADFLEPLRPPDGVVAVRGYHDRKRFWDSLPDSSEITLLTNSHHAARRGEDCLLILGIQTAHVGHLDRGQNQIREAMGGLPESGFRILIGQSPDFLRYAQGHGIDLILAVDNLHHQIRIPGLGVLRKDSKVSPSWDRGWLSEGTLSMYLSPGIGTRWLPFRFFFRPEITLIELEK